MKKEEFYTETNSVKDKEESIIKTILFQGDYITDCGRDRSDFEDLGSGYPRLVEAHIGLENPGEFIFINNGVSGNRVPDIYARIVGDIITLHPDYMSILIGVNDVWRSVDSGCGTGIKRFQKVYDMLLEEIKEELPETKIIILEPFLRGLATDDREYFPDRYSVFRKGVAELSVIAKKIAEKHGDLFFELQSIFDEAAAKAPSPYWFSNGVHSTAKGHELIKKQWLKAFDRL